MARIADQAWQHDSQSEFAALVEQIDATAGTDAVAADSELSDDPDLVEWPEGWSVDGDSDPVMVAAAPEVSPQKDEADDRPLLPLPLNEPAAQKARANLSQGPPELA